ncbi:hypothetical protein [Nocardia concava]|uniref:hypothetical protein n=1 Tax=Nocardia concava TaxID=257281 RepID=UPI0002F8124B|nr:hypothetical protein [Nocardia concava]
MNTHGALTVIRKPLTCMVIAGTLFATAAGVAAAEPGATGPQAPGNAGTSHVVVTYDDNGYPRYDYVYIDPAPQPPSDPAANRLGTGGEERTWRPVPRPDGSGWTVCRPSATPCQ